MSESDDKSRHPAGGQSGPADPSPSPAAADAMALLDSAQQFVDVAAGYKARAELAGFRPYSAERMAVDYHRALLHHVFIRTAGA